MKKIILLIVAIAVLAAAIYFLGGKKEVAEQPTQPEVAQTETAPAPVAETAPAQAGLKDTLVAKKEELQNQATEATKAEANNQINKAASKLF